MCARGRCDEATLAALQARLAAATAELPGCVPHTNARPITIQAAQDQQPLLAALLARFAHLPEAYWRNAMARGDVRDDREHHATPEQPVRAGMRFWHHQAATVEPPVATQIELVYLDASLAVLQKPAPLPMHACGRFHLNTLAHLLAQAWPELALKPCHRLDANTTGLVVMARAREAARHIQLQFEAGHVEKRYLARVYGRPPHALFRNDAPLTAKAGPLGSRQVASAAGVAASTEFATCTAFADGTTLVEARPITGRTNQIRIHLWQLGLPIVGDPTYLPGQQLGATQTLAPEAAPMCLHAYALTLKHPLDNNRLQLTSPRPAWATRAEAGAS